MSDIIRLLPDSLANQIAAGEVIQRPASAVKELLENAIDAGSSAIKLIIKDAGKALIQVIDDGCGMSETDARMCFERHATSKINKVDDLFSIRTMGFRGEAMASIAAIAQVELKTKRVQDELGTVIKIEGAEFISQDPGQVSNGTSISIKNLFYNVPARRNFLKSNPVETRHIIDEFQRVALAHPHIFFSLHHNDLELFHLQSGNLKQRIKGVFGKNHDAKIVPVDEQLDFLKVYGFVGKPEFAKKTRGEQYFFVNNRFIKNAYLNHAVFTNYDDLIPNGSFPFFVLFLEIDPGRIDINVHPTKQEIKFDDEKSVYSFIRVSVKHALGKFQVTPTLDFEQELSMVHTQARGDSSDGSFVQKSLQEFSSKGNAWKINPDVQRSKASVEQWEQLYDIPAPVEESTQSITTIQSDFGKKNEQWQEAPTPFQVHQRYIASPIKSGFILVDQHAAHERILYERFVRSFENKQHHTQRLLFPQTINCSSSDARLLHELLPDINQLGFDMEAFGDNDFAIHGIPTDMEGSNEQVVIEALLEDYKNTAGLQQPNRRDQLARSLAHHAAIKHGKKLAEKEMRELIDELFACEQPYFSPNGSRTITTFDFDELEKRFSKNN